MKKKNMLTIHMLGEFTIENEYNRFPKDRKKSVQVIILIAYLIAHRQSMATKSVLMDVLWPDHDIDNPEGALRNLVYRARKEMSLFYPDDKKKKCIISKGNAYAWNTEVPQIIDIDDMEVLCERIVNQKNLEDIRMDALQLCSRYNDSFMYEFSSESWVRDLREHYHGMMLHAVEKACKLYIEEEKYEYIIELCSYIDFKQFYHSSIHECKLFAYYKLNQIALAISYYHRVVDMYYSNMGVKPTDRMKEIYKLLSEKSLQNSLSVTTLEENLNETRNDTGAFYCDFEIFRNIYQINQRSAHRSTRAKYLVLLTLSGEEETTSKTQLQEEADILHKVIMEDLRKNDVYSKCNSAQYVIIVATNKLEGCMKAIDRIVSKFEMKKKHREINLTFDIRDII